MKIGILRETKTPPDRRVPLTPGQCKELVESHKELKLLVQPSDYRCYSNEEYIEAGIQMKEDLSSCDILMGVKEVKMDTLMPGKKYLFFSHTAKEQPYNRNLLKEIAKLGITLMDYEYLTRADNTRVVAFGRWAGIVGAYNGIKAYGQREKLFDIPPAWQLKGLEDMKEILSHLHLGSTKIVLTGGGRVAGGAVEVLQAAGTKELQPDDYLKTDSKEATFCRLDPWHYTSHKDNKEFDFKDFIKNPGDYVNAFLPYAEKSNLYMACHFWDPESPKLLQQNDLIELSKRLKVIADISCDINGPIASTIRASTIAEPVYGYHPATGKETDNPFGEGIITVMAVDNLPGELPRDASKDFGNALIAHVLPGLLGDDSEGIIDRSMITKNGKLTERFGYLEDYLNEE